MERSDTMDYLIGHDLPVPEKKIQINISNAEKLLDHVYTLFLDEMGKEYIRIPQCQQVIDWLTNNEGRGLFLYGDCGLGKSMLARYVLPAILLSEIGKTPRVLTATEMNNSLDELLSKNRYNKILSIDDVGTESILNKYGAKRMAFAEVMDAVERESKLIIISSNLNGEEIENRYGTRTYERIISTTKRIEFRGRSFRV